MTLAKKYTILSYSQVSLQVYRSDLPDYLIGMIDQVIKADQYNILRYDFLRYPLDQLVYSERDPQETIWLYLDPHGEANILSRSPHSLFPPRNAKVADKPEYKPELTCPSEFQSFNLSCANILSSKLQPNQVQEISRVKIISLDQIRLKCEANIYTSPIDLDLDFKRLISWNQVFRATSLKTFQYLSILHEKIVAILIKKDFFKRFYQIKQNDLNKLTRYETQFKTNAATWPVIPTFFREYEEIDRYVPTPAQRAPIINQRILSKKQPIECPEDCVCLVENLPEGKQFCKYSLLSGWETDCPNRARKIECKHQSQEKKNKCRNSEIQKHSRKRCLGKLLSEGEEPQIEERLTWGVDLFTRSIIFHCLPQIDIEGTHTKVNNESRRNYFIQHSLAKAMNFMGTEGYNIVDTCKFIKAHAQLPDEESKQNTTFMIHQKPLKQKSQQKLFSQRDYFYADLLIRNYELSVDKSSFRIHTKGKGAICIDKKGIPHGRFITEYFGQIYEPWRWYDRQDFIKEVMKKKKMKNFIPEFYNIMLEKHVDEPLGYDILVIDPSRMGNFSSRFSHSCDPNCGTVITVSEGKYFIGMYSFKDIEYGEQLTFDYCSMTESNYEHLNSICLCGMQRCRGNYLQLSNNKIFNNLMDNRNCFYTRNSAILRSFGEVTKEELEICALNNIKEGFLDGAPNWIIKWMARILTFIESEGEIYKQSLIDQWRKVYPWDNSEDLEEKERKIELYSQTNKGDLISIRFQNLITSVDKLKYFFSRNQQNNQPPIFIESPSIILQVLITKKDSILIQVQQHLITYKCEALAQIIQNFIEKIQKIQAIQEKLFLFRLCCLVVSHKLLFLTTVQFNYQLLSDILYFYSFTHTYFSPNTYKPFEADQIVVALSEILGEKGHVNQRKEKSKKKYASPFVWGQMASWYKQTIVCPQASLSQDRRGTLSYPIIKSIMKSEYPYEKQSRAHFLKIIAERPANSWPPAPGCDLSFKNPYKLYGTILFENVHSRQKLENKLPQENLLQSCLSAINSNLKTKLQIFYIVERCIQNIPETSELYRILDGIQLNFEQNVPISSKSPIRYNENPRKRVKRDQIEKEDDQ